MASNTASPFGIELGDVQDLHGSSVTSIGPRRPVNGGAFRETRGREADDALGSRRAARSGFSAEHVASGHGFDRSRVAPFAALAARQGRPLRVAILSDFTRIPYANGAAFQTRFLYQELTRCGHEVTVIGPHDPDATPEDLAPGTIELPSLPLKAYPGVYIPMPLESWVYKIDRFDFDLVFAQTTTLLMEFGVWLRKMRGIPLLCVNTTHLAAAYEVLLPERLSKVPAIHAGLEITLKRPYERLFAKVYNDSDGLIVLSEGLRSYWRERGVTAPIHVVPRAVQPEIFDKPLGEDPYQPFLGGTPYFDGARLLCAGRHTREKAQDRVIRIFARHIAPKDPHATLTMLGDGPERSFYQRIAREEGVESRVFFPGEVPFTRMVDYYGYADVFVHASLSETYGNVMGEALWCGTPTVAYADGMGVSSQIRDGVNGVLLAPGSGTQSEVQADAAFGRAVLRILSDPEGRARLGTMASKLARERCSPLAVQDRLADTFRSAQDHAAACGLRPNVRRPRPMQWLTTFQHFRSWATINAGVYIAGHLRPASGEKRREQKHPQIGR